MNTDATLDAAISYAMNTSAHNREAALLTRLQDCLFDWLGDATADEVVAGRAVAMVISEFIDSECVRLRSDADQIDAHRRELNS